MGAGRKPGGGGYLAGRMPRRAHCTSSNPPTRSLMPPWCRAGSGQVPWGTSLWLTGYLERNADRYVSLALAQGVTPTATFSALGDPDARPKYLSGAPAHAYWYVYRPGRFVVWDMRSSHVRGGPVVTATGSLSIPMPRCWGSTWTATATHGKIGEAGSHCRVQGAALVYGTQGFIFRN